MTSRTAAPSDPDLKVWTFPILGVRTRGWVEGVEVESTGGGQVRGGGEKKREVR